jgi:hypothetical protein
MADVLREEWRWGNYLYLQIEDGSNDSGNTFKISIRKQDESTRPRGFPEHHAAEVHDNLDMDPGSPNFVVDVLNRIRV